jgi:hypothetical protein
MPLNPATFESLVKIYQGEIDSLIQNMGKDVIIHFHKTETTVDPEFFDPIRGTGTRMPDYKETDSIGQPAETNNTRTIKALVKHTPDDYETYGIKVKNPKGIVRLKTFLTDIPDLMRCDYIVPNAGSVAIVGAKFRLIRTPVPVGLKHDRYAISFWEMV